jgi:hypothetical protein
VPPFGSANIAELAAAGKQLQPMRILGSLPKHCLPRVQQDHGKAENGKEPKVSL